MSSSTPPTAAAETLSYNYCALPLAAYACRPDQSRGRLHDEPESQHRTPFQRDRDRIIHSSAFRRLKYKTQVFVYHEGDHFRTRLTHTLEVAQITRTLARALYVNEDLAETVALAHDLGHTPFAHKGEEVMKRCMTSYGGFEHNDQSLRVLTVLEQKYPLWNGLNLTWETLEGVVKHNGPVPDQKIGYTLRSVSEYINLGLKTYASLEAQVAALADDIAYNNHDVEDGLRAGLFRIEDVREQVPLLDRLMTEIQATYPAAPLKIQLNELVREMIGAMVEDVLTETRRRLAKVQPTSSDDVRRAGEALVAFSPEMGAEVKRLRAFLFERMYRHSSVNRMLYKVERIVGDLFSAFMDSPDLMPEHWQARLPESGGNAARARVVADYIAGMTDRFAIREHERLFDLYRDLK